MEFLLHLSPVGKDIFHLLSRHIRFEENAAVCRKHEVYGWYDSRTNVMTIGTDRVKRGPDSAYYFNETLFHEAVHVAQDCKARKTGQWYAPFGINPSKMKLSERRRADLNTATKMHPENRAIEHEAFWMEDKPEKVRYVLKKYCL